MSSSAESVSEKNLTAEEIKTKLDQLSPEERKKIWKILSGNHSNGSSSGSTVPFMKHFEGTSNPCALKGGQTSSVPGDPPAVGYVGNSPPKYTIDLEYPPKRPTSWTTEDLKRQLSHIYLDASDFRKRLRETMTTMDDPAKVHIAKENIKYMHKTLRLIQNETAKYCPDMIPSTPESERQKSPSLSPEEPSSKKSRKSDEVKVPETGEIE